MSEEFNAHPAARDEFRVAIRHYAEVDEEGELALAFEAAFYHHLGRVIANPLLYNIRRLEVRRVNLVPRFGEYYIAYMVWREKVVILAVAHARRRPFYWRERIAEAKKMF